MKNSAVPRLAFRSLFWLLPLLVCSYFPLLQLGTIAGIHIDISLLYVAVIAVVILNLPYLWRHIDQLQTLRSWQLFLLFIVYVWLSAVWSANPTRAVVTAGFFTILLALFSVVISHAPKLQAANTSLRRPLLIGFLLISLVAIWQLIADALRLPSQFSLLPAMYSGDVFGVARPTGFALEPQFFGSILLLPFLYSSYMLLSDRPQRFRDVLFVLSASLLLLTLSRGALLAAFIGVVVLLITLHMQMRAVLRFALLGLLSVLIVAALTFSFATLRPDAVSGQESLRRVVNQLSLGTLARSESTPRPSTRLSSHKATAGYVASSTQSRLSMTQRALELWSSSPVRILFGVGVGGFGAALHAQDPDLPVGLIVNNFYAEMLAELGLVGTGLFALFIGTLFFQLIRTKHYLLFALMVAFLVQWYFFSGTANTIHIWVIAALAAAYSTTKRVKSA